MDQNKVTADANATALSHILEALRQAKTDIAPLYQTYLEKNDDWVPGWWDNAEDELDEQARKRMRQAEEIIAHPDNALKAPDPYEFAPGEYVSKPIEIGGDGSGSGAASVPSASGIGASGGFQVPHDPPPPLPSPGSSSPSPDASQSSLKPNSGTSGPDLAGVITPASGPAPAANAAVPSAPAGVPAGQPSPGLVIGGGLPPGVSGPGGRGGRGGVAPFGISQPTRGVGGTTGSRGGLPVTKPATPPWLAPAASQPSRGGSSSGARSGNASVMPTAGGRRSADRRDEDEVTFDPDSPWATAEGVTPVIEPSRKQHRHDPGPGVIGWRR